MDYEQLDEKSIFNVARQIDSSDVRCEYLRQVCGANDTLRERIEDLLIGYEEQASFLERPPVARLTPTLDQSIGQTTLDEKADTQIGPYKLRERIGEGGFGLVFVAEQVEPVRRKVALKVIKPGMDTKDVIARFEAERQALALMDHPNIARVLDAGSTDDGHPFFAMELVNGVPITEFCDQQKLSTNERLVLFIDVCLAIQHAHQKGIIHRDIKPSNVMVTMHDHYPVAKVIDFGVAKALGGGLTQKTIYTTYGQMVGTPMYMSPEQAQLSGLDVDTRSDVYSLGVLAYELLTGSPPFSKESLQKFGLDEMRRIILEEEPRRPSVLVSTLKAENLVTVADQRKIAANQFSRSLKGELDWIVMKSLEKDRKRRYETAASFAEDLKRYLTGEAVHACPPTPAYRARKFLGRYKAGIAATLAMLLLLLGGIAATTRQAVLATQEKVRATNEKNRAVAAEALAEQRLEESEKARAQSEADRRAAVASKEKAVAARKEASDVSRSLCDLLIADGKYYVSAKETTSNDKILVTWAANDPEAAMKWYEEKLANNDLLEDAENQQHLAVFHDLLLGLIASDSEEDVKLYVNSPTEIRPKRDGNQNLTGLLVTKYAQRLVKSSDDSGFQQLFKSMDDLNKQSIVLSAATQFAIAGKLDNGLKFIDEHMPKPWRKGLHPKQPHMNRDDYVSAMAAVATGLDTKGRIDWLIANSSSVPKHVLVAAQKMVPDTLDASLTVETVGVEYQLPQDQVVSRLMVHTKDYGRTILQQQYQSGPPDGSRVFLFLSAKDQDSFVTDSEGCKLESFIDSSGKNLIKESPEPIYIDNGMDKGWFQFEGLRPIRSTGVVQGYKIEGLLAPDDSATYVIAKGMLGARIGTRKQSIRTSSARVEQGAIFKSDGIEFKIRKLESSGFQRLGRSSEQIEQFGQDFPLRMQMSFVPTSEANILLADPSVSGAYTNWRFIDTSGKVHDLVSSGGASWSKHGVVNQGEIELAAKQVVTEGCFEVEFWTDFKTVKVPFDVKVELGGEKSGVDEYNQRIQERVTEYGRMSNP